MLRRAPLCVSALLYSLSSKFATAAPACPAITFTSSVIHTDEGLTFTMLPQPGQPTPDWVVAHMSKNAGTSAPTINLQLYSTSANSNSTSASGTYNPTTGLFSWFLSPAALLWTLSDIPYYSFSYSVNINAQQTTCDSEYFVPSNWAHVNGACPSIPYTQSLTVNDTVVGVSFKGNTGYLQPVYVDFHLGKNCNSTSEINAYANLHAQDVGSSTGCGYDSSAQTWLCNIPRNTLSLNSDDQPCVQTTFHVNGVDCPSTVLYPGFQWQWITGDWGSCSATCGGGVQTRSLTCMGNDGSPDPTGYSCANMQMPMTSQPCNTQACAIWTPSPWSSCSSACGGGTQTRSFTCMDPNSNTPAPGQCSGQQQGATQQTCNTNVCPSWTPAQWSLCSTTCGEGVQTRAIVCTYPNGTVDSTGNACASLTNKPATSQVCTNDAVCPSTNAPTGTSSPTGTPSSAIPSGSVNPSSSSSPTSSLPSSSSSPSSSLSPSTSPSSSSPSSTASSSSSSGSNGENTQNNKPSTGSSLSASTGVTMALVVIVTTAANKLLL